MNNTMSRHAEVITDALELMHLGASLLNNHDATIMDRQRLGWLLKRSADRLGIVVEELDEAGRAGR